MSSLSHAASSAITLKEVKVVKDDEIELSFNKEVSEANVQSEYFDDIFQIVLNDVTVYPAKIIPVNGPNVQKIFAYQYTPQVVRCRLTLSGKVDQFKERLKLSFKGKTIAVRIAEIGEVNEKELMEKVTQGTTQTAIENRVEKNSGDKVVSEKPSIGGDSKSHIASMGEVAKASPTLTANNSGLPSFREAALKLMGVIFLLCLTLVVAKQLIKKGEKGNLSVSTLLTKLGVPVQANKNDLIEVLASHSLDQKKRLTIVKIGNRTFVLGVTQESIQNIAELDMELTDDAFSDILKEEKVKPNQPSRVRTAIRNRLEGLKQL